MLFKENLTSLLITGQEKKILHAHWSMNQVEIDLLLMSAIQKLLISHPLLHMI